MDFWSSLQRSSKRSFDCAEASPAVVVMLTEVALSPLLLVLLLLLLLLQQNTHALL